MKRFRQHIVITALAVLLTAFHAEAAVSFTVQAPRQVAQGSKFNITFVLENAQGTAFTPPEVAGVTKIYGPALSTSYSQSWINGKSSSKSTQEYTMIYKAEQLGKLTIGSASVDVGGSRLTTKPVTIEVVASNHAPDPARQQQRTRPQQQQVPPSVQFDDPFSKDADSQIKAGDLMVRILMSKPRVYEQQAVVCTIKLYTKYEITQFMPTKQPSFDGFLIEEIPMQPSLNKIETINGQKYWVAVLKQCLLYPQQSGKLTITSGTYDVSAVQYERFRTIFGSMASPVEREIKVQSNSQVVNVLPLPEPRPANFSGAVGRFNITTELHPDTIKTYSAATYTYNIKGTGNLKYIKAPDVAFPKEFDVYDPKTDVKVNSGGGDMSGTLTIDYTFIPQYAGSFTLPESEFCYFDPDAGTYRSIPVAARTIKVGKGVGAPSNHYRMQNTDIRHIHTGDLGLTDTRTYMVSKRSFWLWFIVPIALMTALLVYYRKQLRERADLKLMRHKRANKMARRRLKRARALMNDGNRSGFYAELLTALWGYLSDKLGIPVSELSKENITTELEQYGVEENLRADVITLLDKCEFAQYAPDLADSNMAEQMGNAAELIGRLEAVKRKKIASDVNRTLSLLLLISAASLSAVAAPVAAIDSANSAYAHEHYPEALRIYLAQQDSVGTSAALCYNIGNTYYRLNDMPHAILYYERALILNPMDDDARHNLEFVRNRMGLHEQGGTAYFAGRFDTAVARLSSNSWAIISITAFISMLIAIAIYLFTNPIWLRKTGFFGAIVLLFVSLAALWCAFTTYRHAVHRNTAIVTSPSAVASTSPRAPKDKSEVAFDLTEGHKIHLLDSLRVDGTLWYEVATGDDRRGWITHNDITII